MVGKKTPIKRLTVAKPTNKTTSASRSKKLNLDKLLISIKNISTRYKRNGKMTGGEPDPSIKKVQLEIEKFFMKNTFNMVGIKNGETILTKLINELEVIKKDNNIKSAILKSIKDITTVDHTNISKSQYNINTLIYLLLSPNLKNLEVPFHNDFTNSNNETYVYNIIDEDTKKPHDLAKTRIDLFNNGADYAPKIIKVGNTNYPTTLKPEDKKVLAYISILQIAHTLAKIYKGLDLKEEV
jgi:hypothetical protein